MGIDLWSGTRFVACRPPILKVKVLNFKSIKVTRFPGEKSGFPVHMDPEFQFKDFKPEFRIRVNRKSGFFAAKHVTLLYLKFKTLTQACPLDIFMKTQVENN